MKATLRTGDLLSALTRVDKVAPKNTALPILQNVLVNFTSKTAWFTTTDLSQAVRIKVDAIVEKGGRACVHVATLKRVASRAKARGAGAVWLERKGTSLVLSYKSTEVTVTGVEAKEFPGIPKPEKVEASIYITAAELRDKLQRIQPAIGTEPTRPALTHAFLYGTKKEELSVVSTDGWILIKARVGTGRHDKVSALIPDKAVSLLVALIEKNGGACLTIQVYDGGIRFLWRDTEVSTIRGDGNFPDYHGVMPTMDRYNSSLRVDRDELAEALRTVADVLTQEFYSVKITADNGMLAVSASTDKADAQEMLAVKTNGKEIGFAVNPGYLLDALRAMDPGPAELHFIDARSPMLVRSGWDGDSVQAIVMPILV